MARSFFGVFIVVALSFVIAWLVNSRFELSAAVLLVLRVLAISILAWSVLARIRAESDMWNGETLLETTSIDLYLCAYYTGICLTVVSVLLKSN